MTTTRCKICEAPDIAFFTRTYDRHYGYFDRYYDVYRCSNCGVLFINPMISDSELSDMYDEDSYYSYRTFDTASERYRKLRAVARQILRERSKFEPGFKPTRINRCLDIGCGSGKWLFEMKGKGWHVSGVEISKNAATFGNSMGLNVFEGSLNEARFPSDRFDYIRSNHSFEHLTNPVETMSEIRRIIKQEGLIHIGVPNTDSVPFRLFRKYWFYLGIPFHPFSYNTKNLSLLLEKNGFRVIKINHVGNFRGLLGSLQIWLNDGQYKVSTEGKLTNFVTKELFQQFARVLNVCRLGDCIDVIAQKAS